MNGYGGVISSNKAILYSPSAAILKDIFIINNSFNDGAVGINFDNSSPAAGTVIQYNTFTNISRGIDIQYNDGVQVLLNEINASDIAVYLYECDGAIQVLKNKITTSGSHAIYLQSCDATSGNNGLIANNFVTTTSLTGLNINTNNSYQNIYHNSIYSGTSSSALYINSSSTFINIVNNILYNASTGFAFNVDNASSIETSDYNDIYSSGDYIARWAGTDAATIEELQTASGKDLNSISKEINFVSATDLHLTGSSIGDYDLSGIMLSEVTDDIDGETRYTTPYMGADEIPSSPLPVELTSFTVRVKDNIVHLNWLTKTEVNNYGFEIERSTENEWFKLGFVEGNGNSNSDKFYSFIDKNISGGNKFQYRLKQIDNDGQYEYSKVIEVEVIPVKYALFQNYPNPFNPITRIRYQLPSDSKVIMKVYNMLGAEVKELLNEKKEAGIYEIEFSASSFGGLSSGTYIYRLIAQNHSGQTYIENKKMILIK